MKQLVSCMCTKCTINSSHLDPGRKSDYGFSPNKCTNAALIFINKDGVCTQGSSAIKTGLNSETGTSDGR